MTIYFFSANIEEVINEGQDPRVYAKAVLDKADDLELNRPEAPGLLNSARNLVDGAKNFLFGEGKNVECLICCSYHSSYCCSHYMLIMFIPKSYAEKKKDPPEASPVVTTEDDPSSEQTSDDGSSEVIEQPQPIPRKVVIKAKRRGSPSSSSNTKMSSKSKKPTSSKSYSRKPSSDDELESMTSKIKSTRGSTKANTKGPSPKSNKGQGTNEPPVKLLRRSNRKTTASRKYQK